MKVRLWNPDEYRIDENYPKEKVIEIDNIEINNHIIYFGNKEIATLATDPNTGQYIWKLDNMEAKCERYYEIEITQ